MSTLITLNPKKIVEIKNPLLVSNMIELDAIKKYKGKHPDLTMNEAATQWINRYAATWRARHPLEIIKSEAIPYGSPKA